MLCLCHYGPALLSFWFQTNLERENSASYLEMLAGKTFFVPRSRVGHALRLILCSDWSKFDRVSSCGKFMQHLETCLFWQLKLTEFCVNLCGFVTVFFPVDVQNEMQLLSRVICYSWLVCLLGVLVESILGDPGAVSQVNKMFVVKKNI